MATRASDLWNSRGVMSRGDYAKWGLGLFFLKYNLDRLLGAWLFGQTWLPWSYLLGNRGQPGPANWSPNHLAFAFCLLLTSLLFIWAGVVMTLRRLRDVGWPRWLVVVFFLPFINLLFFAFLCACPGHQLPPPGGTLRLRLVATLGLERRLNAAVLGVVAGLLLALSLILFGTLFLKDYGWGLFVGTPFMIGFFSALFYGLAEPRTWGGCLGVAAVSVTLVGAALLLLAVEGFFCVLMAAPIALVLALFGATLGWIVQLERHGAALRGATLYCAAWVVAPLLMVTEAHVPSVPPLIEARSVAIINAPPEAVWRQVVTFRDLAPPRELIFRTGVAYPLRASLEGRGVGAVRHCVFTTGAFVEPITVWDENRQLAFDVQSQPHPMREWSPYAEIHPAHLEGFFRSRRGEFLLTRLPDGRTQLTGTTWYEQNLWPNGYWRLWSDCLIHAIHRRVLEHIKAEAERI
jgi:uncharacterized membrane protein YhaH (DUF805 family)